MVWTKPAINVIWGLAGVFILLILATLIIQLLSLTLPERNYTELKQRVKSWWAITLLFSTSLILSPGIAVIFFGFVSFLALKEYLSLIPTRRADRRVLFWAYLAIILQYYWIYSRWYGMFLVFIPVYMFLILPMRC